MGKKNAKTDANKQEASARQTSAHAATKKRTVRENGNFTDSPPAAWTLYPNLNLHKGVFTACETPQSNIDLGEEIVLLPIANLNELFSKSKIDSTNEPLKSMDKVFDVTLDMLKEPCKHTFGIDELKKHVRKPIPYPAEVKGNPLDDIFETKKKVNKGNTNMRAEKHNEQSIEQLVKELEKNTKKKRKKNKKASSDYVPTSSATLSIVDNKEEQDSICEIRCDDDVAVVIEDTVVEELAEAENLSFKKRHETTSSTTGNSTSCMLSPPLSVDSPPADTFVLVQEDFNAEETNDSMMRVEEDSSNIEQESKESTIEDAPPSVSPVEMLSEASTLSSENDVVISDPELKPDENSEATSSASEPNPFYLGAVELCASARREAEISGRPENVTVSFFFDDQLKCTENANQEEAAQHQQHVNAGDNAPRLQPANANLAPAPQGPPSRRDSCFQEITDPTYFSKSTNVRWLEFIRGTPPLMYVPAYRRNQNIC